MSMECKSNVSLVRDAEGRINYCKPDGSYVFKEFVRQVDAKEWESMNAKANRVRDAEGRINYCKPDGSFVFQNWLEPKNIKPIYGTNCYLVEEHGVYYVLKPNRDLSNEEGYAYVYFDNNKGTLMAMTMEGKHHEIDKEGNEVK